MSTRSGLERRSVGYIWSLCIRILLITLTIRVRKQLANKEITVAGSDWPIFLYQNEQYDADRPWKGLFRNRLLILVSCQTLKSSWLLNGSLGIQTHFHVSQFCRRGTEGHPLWKRQNTWHDACHTGFNRICRNSGRVIPVWMPFHLCGILTIIY